MEVPNFSGVLTLLAQGIGVGGILAFLFEQFTFFQNLPSKTKWWVMIGVNLLLPLIAQALLQFVPAEVWVAIEPYWRSLALGFLAWAGSQAVHLLHKRLK
jgi:hypothetical protein